MKMFHSSENNLSVILAQMARQRGHRACGILPAKEDALAGMVIVMAGARAMDSLAGVLRPFIEEHVNPNTRPFLLTTDDCLHCVFAKMEKEGLRALVANFDDGFPLKVVLFSGDQTCRDAALLLNSVGMKIDAGLLDANRKPSAEVA